jgi:hypothetical protein
MVRVHLPWSTIEHLLTDSVVLNLNGKTICDSEARYGLDSRATSNLAPNGKAWQVITEMTQCTEPVPVKKGDVLQMVSIYDNELHPPRMSADGEHGDSDEMVGMFDAFLRKTWLKNS